MGVREDYMQDNMENNMEDIWRRYGGEDSGLSRPDEIGNCKGDENLRNKTLTQFVLF